MKRPENDKWLNGALEEVIGSEKPRTDFEAWKQNHPEAVEMLTLRADGQASASPSPLTIRRIIMKNQITKYATVIALICTGVVAATAVGIKIHKWRVESKHPEYGYMLHSEDGKTVTNIPDSWADNPEHAVKVKEELDLLKQQDNRKLVGASEYIVNDQLDNRWLLYEYNLSDGQTIEVSERDPDDNGPGALTREQKEEMDQLWHEQLDTEYWQDFVTTEEKQVYGSALSFRKWKLVLSDGTEVVYSIGNLKKD